MVIPGGWRRERYLALIREWAGRGAEIANPYDPVLVRSAPRDIRHILADALAEEASARQLGQLGIAFTIWHDVATSGGPDEKIDHVVLGPTGLFALLSEDWGGPVKVRKGELVGDTLGHGEHPFAALGARSRGIAQSGPHPLRRVRHRGTRRRDGRGSYPGWSAPGSADRIGCALPTARAHA